MAELNEQTQAQELVRRMTESEPKKALSEKAQAARAKAKELRQTKVDYRAAGVIIGTVQATSPKKVGSKARAVWDHYEPGMKVADLLAWAELDENKERTGGKAYAQACIVWDVRHGFIGLAPAPAAEQPAPEQAAS